MSKKPKATARKAAQASTAVAVIERGPGEITVGQTSPPTGAQTIVEKLIELAKDPGVDVVKINALIDANERVMAIGAKQQFDQAFAEMQAELPIITRTGLAKITKDGKPIRETSYARDVDIAQAVKPTLAKYGFALRHRNKMQDGILTVTGILSHRGGHREEDEFQTGRDDSAGKNMIQSWGSARSYGKRYTTIALLHISSEDPRDFDDDGAGTSAGGYEEEWAPEAPRRQAPPARQPSPKDEEPITQGTKQRPGQVERLWVIIRNSGRNEETIREWLQARYGYTSTKDIKRKHYEEICKAIEADGKLPGTRVPGEEG